jgi:hypothetical protein
MLEGAADPGWLRGSRGGLTGSKKNKNLRGNPTPGARFKDNETHIYEYR